MQTVQEITLTNGLVVLFRQQARRYFGDYHQVRLEVSCEVPVTRELFVDDSSYWDALSQIGKTLLYRRTEEQVGVESAAVAGCVRDLIDRFRSHALPYFQSPEFPRRLVLAELNRLKRPVRRFIPGHAHG